MIQNFLLIWIDDNIDECNEDCQNTLTELRSVTNNINIFKIPNECVHFLNKVGDKKVLIIIAGTIGERIVPLIHEMPQISAIYIHDDNISSHEQLFKVWIKVKGVYTQITSICEALRHTIKHYDRDLIAISFITADHVTSNQNLDQLDSSFMYTQIFKEILLEIKYDRQSITNFTAHCRNACCESLKDINEFEDNYYSELAIWYYTRFSFIFAQLNGALRTLQIDTIINMGFFIHDLHHQIEQLYRQQLSSCPQQPFTVYRGQGLSTIDFEKLLNTRGGLMSFNNFLSTSKDRRLSLIFAESVLTNTETVGILFKMVIDPLISLAPFADVRDISAFGTEEEVLFSMHLVFRVGEIKKIDSNDRLYEVGLKLTADDDQQLRMLTKRIREETAGFGWQRLAMLLIKIGHFKKAEELYTVLLEQTSDEDEKAVYYNNLGSVKDKQGDYEKALFFFEKVTEIYEKTLTPNHPNLAASYNNIGLVYKNMGDYAKTLSFFTKAFEIFQKTLAPNDPNLGVSYNNLGGVYKDMRENSKALFFYEKALEIREKTLPRNHPDLATSYNNIGSIYHMMGGYSTALSFYGNALEIEQKSLPSTHPSLSTSFKNMGEAYNSMGEYPKALSFYEKALEIEKKTFSPSHPSLATSYNNIGLVHQKMGEYSKALSFYEHAIGIVEISLPPNHPHIAISYSNIGTLCTNMGEYRKALSFYEKVLEIYRQTPPPDHPNLATLYNNMGVLYKNLGEYSKGISFYEKALQIKEKTLPSSHPSLATSYINIGEMYRKMEEYEKALSFSEKAREIFQNTLPANHPHLATCYNNIGLVYKNMKENSNALLFYEKALEIRQITLLPNHPDLAISYNNIGEVYRTMGEYSKALSSHEKALEIRGKTFPSNHTNLAQSYNNIGGVYDSMGEYSKALSFYERALDIRQHSLPSNHPDIQKVREHIEIAKKKL